MNKGIVGAIGFAAGLVVGYILGDKSIIENLKSKKVEEVIEFTPEKKEDPEGENEKTTPSKFEKPELEQLVKKYRSDESEYTDYSNEKEEPYPPEDYLSPEEDDDDDEEDESPEVEFSKPQLMTLHEFENEKKNYETCTLTYYVWDDTVCDYQDNVVPNPEDLIGDDALLCFGMGSQDPNTVYICNDKRGVKYEVVKVDNSYQEVVLGLKNDGLSTNKKRREDIDQFD